METAPLKPEVPDQVETVPTETKPKKEKKPATPAQQAARDKGLQAMLAKRKEIAAKQIQKKEEVKTAKRIVENKILKEDLAFATKQDFDSLRRELMELRAHHEATKISAQEKPKAAPPERIVERIVEKHVPTVTAAPSKLTGHALLDRLFFDK